ncbi:MAG: hypothetical protein AAGG75_19200 [Bacteroidota bacterium]
MAINHNTKGGHPSTISHPRPSTVYHSTAGADRLPFLTLGRLPSTIAPQVPTVYRFSR